MKFKIMGKSVAAILALISASIFPVNAETKQMELTAEQETLVKEAMGEKYEDVRNAINAELQDMFNNNVDLMAIEEELKTSRGLLAARKEEESKAGIPAANSQELTSAEVLKGINDQVAAQKVIIEQLMGESVGDRGKVINMNTKSMRTHSSTHLNASGEQYDAFEGRNWNLKAANMSNSGVSNFNDKVDIPLLQGDIEHFVRKNPAALVSIFNDIETLPTDWGKLSGIVDRVVSGLVAPSEITQGNNGGWNPKGEILIDVEEGRVYDKKIDITLTGAKLKSIEKTWLSFLNGSDGSHPWKTTFVGFLLGEYVKQIALDSRIAQVNGIYVKTPVTKAGKNDNSQNGLRALWFWYRDIAKQYVAFDMGNPTEANIVDYVDAMIKRIPQKERNQLGYEIQMSYEMLNWYKTRAGEKYVLQFATDQGKSVYNGSYPLNYPNYKFQPLIDQNNTLFIGITKSLNIVNLQYLENEKGEMTMTRDKRDTNMFADFKEGITFIQVGRKMQPGEPKEFEYQRLYSNTCPIFDAETRVPFYYKGGTIVSFKFPEFFSHIEIVENDYPANITKLEGLIAGQLCTIKGNESLAANRLVKSNADMLLVTDFQLNTGGTLTMIVQENGKLKELFRTSTPSAAPETSKNFATAIIDAKTGNVFKFNGGATTTVANIINGTENKTIRVYGTDTAGVDVVLDDAANINVASIATLLTAVNYIELILVGGVWYEVSRNV